MRPLPDAQGIASATGLALFDLDHTLLPIDSDSAWASYLISRGVRDKTYYEEKNRQFYEQYKNGTLDIYEFLDFVFEPLKGMKLPELLRWRADFIERFIQPHIRPRALQLVQDHIDRGNLCVIITATNSWTTAPIADMFGVHALIGTDLEVRDNEFTGKPLGTPSFREGKIIRAKQWLAQQGRTLDSFAEQWFYSDSSNDLPLLREVNRPVAVMPDAKLLAEARAKAWQVLMLHDDIAEQAQVKAS